VGWIVAGARGVHGLALCTAALVGACHRGDSSDRDPGEVIDVVSDLPHENQVDGYGGEADCARLEACLVGPSEGSVTIETAEDLAGLAGVRCIHGSLTVSAPGVVDLRDLASLEVVCSGQLTIRGNPDLVDTVGMTALDPTMPIWVQDNPRLTRVSVREDYTGNLDLEGNPKLASIASLAALTHFDIAVSDCESLEVFSLPNLESGDVYLDSDAALATVDLPALEAGRVTLVGAPLLTALHLPSLQQSDDLVVRGAPGITAIETPALVELEHLHLSGNAALTSVPALGQVTSIGHVEIEANPLLDDVSWIASLTALEHLRIVNNPALAQSDAEATAFGRAVTSKIAGNAGWVVPPMCPFSEDGECDEPECHAGLGVCGYASDPGDCCRFGCSEDCPMGGS
jgi:hypothetical protein